ncbi:MAG: type II toxin-antitoxin system Phd/YefM family antitoxin [Rhodoplanes sp.]|uniref:type II toxin-antitoxin system Phd/YefM family antitoxin n=1 Tax=Rhodoplanes sp. TaxID=1968906 RepID=UPI00182B89FA|nr:type II toxin-antitoxin system Phd/YefM family antitoxin [Rhodoplanes sp.]NVO17967.1 type II toxin-antitoxin system Phd/YefM family antitoxin [Rhodoplanes sp.]
MKFVPAQDAADLLPSLVTAAEHGEPTTIMRDGKAVAVLVPVDAARKLYPDEKRDFLAFLKEFPGGADFDRIE